MRAGLCCGREATYNPGKNNLRAEGNDFSTTVAAEIEAKIYDQLDCPGAGRADYTPLAGGINPTIAERPALAVMGVVATPTFQGAEIAFSLSVPAQLVTEVLNLVRRSVADLAPYSGTAGRNRVSWNGLSSRGVPLPGGVYLVRLIAQGQAASQASALALVTIDR